MQSSTNKFLVAYNVLTPSTSIIISSADSFSSEELKSEIDPCQFLCKGIWLCVAKPITSGKIAQDRFFEIVDEEGNQKTFELTEIIQCFPIIEGVVTAGLYQFYQTESEYYEIKDTLALSVFFDGESDFDYETEKFICDDNEIGIHDIRTENKLISYERRSLTFFDVYCPICRKLITSYKVVSERFLCEPIFLSCPHFAGYATWTPDGYEKDELNALNVKYKISGDSLYLKTEHGWQKPVVYVPPYHRLNSFWGSSPVKDAFVSHFFFVKEEPEFWIK